MKCDLSFIWVILEIILQGCVLLPVRRIMHPWNVLRNDLCELVLVKYYFLHTNIWCFCIQSINLGHVAIHKSVIIFLFFSKCPFLFVITKSEMWFIYYMSNFGIILQGFVFLPIRRNMHPWNVFKEWFMWACSSKVLFFTRL